MNALPGFDPVMFNYYSRPPLSSLSNFAPVRILFEGDWYPSVEHAYQAAKTIDPVQRERVRRAITPGLSKRFGSTVTIRSNWNDIRVGVMRQLLVQKFDQPEYREILLATGPDILVHEAPWDSFWGSGRDNKGTNILGKLLMSIREELS